MDFSVRSTHCFVWVFIFCWNLDLRQSNLHYLHVNLFSLGAMGVSYIPSLSKSLLWPRGIQGGYRKVVALFFCAFGTKSYWVPLTHDQNDKSHKNCLTLIKVKVQV